MEKLREVFNMWMTEGLSDYEALIEIFKTFIIGEGTLKNNGLTIEYEDYGIWKLRQNGEYLMEGEETDCYQRASEIIYKRSK